MRGLRDALAGLRGHPVLSRETTARLASPVTPVALTVFLASVAAVACILFSMAATGSPGHLPGAGQLERVAYHAMAFQIALAVVVAPALTAGAISGERERGTLDLLLVGDLTSRSIVVAKLAAVVSYVGLFTAAALPLYVAVFLHAGLGLGQLAAGEVLTMAAALGAAALGLFLSALCPRTSTATLAACALALTLSLDVVLSGLVPAPGTGLAQTRSQLLVGAVGVDTTDVVADESGVPLPPKQERIAPLRLANPLYALHKAVTDPEPDIDPAGVPVARVVRSLVPGDTSWSTWGLRLKPWQYSVAAAVMSSLVLLLGAVRLVDARRGRRRTGRRPARRDARERVDAQRVVAA